MAKKKKNETPSDQEPQTFYDKLLEQREHLNEYKDALLAKTSSQIGGVGFMGALGGVALLADWTLTGGFFTILAGADALSYMNVRTNLRKVDKDLKDIDEKILQLELMPDFQKNRLEHASKLKDDFAKSQFTIGQLSQQLQDLQRQVAEARDPKPENLVKPRLMPPPK